MARRVGRVLWLPVRLVDWTLRRVFGEPMAEESRRLRDATERAEEYRRQVDRSHR